MRKKIFLPVIDNGMGLSRTSWAVCFAGMCLDDTLRGYDVIMQPLSYPYPNGAMDIASNDFLLSDADEMLVIDTDVLFSSLDVVRLLSHEVDLVFGMYPKKELGLNFPIELLGEENPFSTTPLAEGVNPLVEVKRSARGFMRVKRRVFETLAPHVGKYIDAQTGKTFHEFWKCLPGGHSEDFFFCDLWRSHGGKVLIDQRVTARHEGTAVYPISGTY